ncbi:MAG: hypothetical protein UT09_C0002G0026 [Parcubacteria group bacterium GW2011_GWF2_38_8]|nr:MAG: hypothetical protein UT09_C0002G0026 [Parcubacteria group bacterium GW2011_GWF2_38_8]
MNKIKIVLILGVWTAVLPYSGFPIYFKNILFSVSGLLIAYFSYLLYKESKTKDKGSKTFENFSENNDFNEKDKLNQQAVSEENKN